jgi:hypothetical protein
MTEETLARPERIPDLAARVAEFEGPPTVEFIFDAVTLGRRVMASSANYREGEGPGFVPPRKFLRKMLARLDRLGETENGALDGWRMKQSGPNHAWVSAYDDYLEHTRDLLISLLGMEDAEDT